MHSYISPTIKLGRKSAFTLVEIVVVLAVIGVLIVMLAPAFNRFLTGNAVTAAERMISSQLSLVRAEAAYKRCKIALVIYNPTSTSTLLSSEPSTKYSSFHVAYEDTSESSAVWKWLPNTQRIWLPAGVLIVGLKNTTFTAPMSSGTDYIPDNITFPNTEDPTKTQSFPAIIFNDKGKPEGAASILLQEAVLVNTEVKYLSSKYGRCLDLNAYTGRVTFKDVQ